MGLFNFSYDKPGPGVSKDAPPQKAVPRFFSILGRKFFDLVKLNLLCCVPAAVIVLIMFLILHVTSSPYLVLLPVILFFPFWGGLTIVTRNYVREEHAFILSDFVDAVKQNYRAFLLNGLLCYAVFSVLSISIPYYFQMGPKNILYTAGTVICIVLSIFFLFSQYYVPVLIVTFDLKFIQIIKNSLIFSILGVGRNFLVTAILGAIFFLCYLSQASAFFFTVMILFLLFLVFAFSSFLINFAVYPLVNKTMIIPYKKDERQEAENDFSDKI